MTKEEQQKPATVVPVKSEGELLQALAIREIVFIEEQHVPAGIERDAEDARAFHVLAFQEGHAIGTRRLVMLSQPPQGQAGKWAQIGRMAVLQDHRGSGTGSKLLVALEDQARKNQVAGITLHAQLTSIDFYKKHDYQPVGAAFEEAGMPHLEMHKKLGS